MVGWLVVWCSMKYSGLSEKIWEYLLSVWGATVCGFKLLSALLFVFGSQCGFQNFLQLSVGEGPVWVNPVWVLIQCGSPSCKGNRFSFEDAFDV